MNEESERINESIRRMHHRVDRLTHVKTKTIREIDSVIAEINADIKAL